MTTRRRAVFDGAAQVAIVCAVSVVAAGISAELSLLAFEVEPEPVVRLDAQSTPNGFPIAKAQGKAPGARPHQPRPVTSRVPRGGLDVRNQPDGKVVELWTWDVARRLD